MVEPTPEPDIELGVALHLWYGYDLDADEMTGGLGADHWNSGIANGTGIHDNISVVPDLGFYASDGTGLRVPLGKSIGGLTSSHWNTDIGGRGRVTDEPEYGFYASDDPKAIAQQLQDMERAGINTIFVSWFGWGDDKLDGNIDSPEGEAMHRATIALLDYISNSNAPFKVAIAVEAFGHKEWPVEQQQIIADYLYDNIYSVQRYRLLSSSGKASR